VAEVVAVDLAAAAVVVAAVVVASVEVAVVVASVEAGMWHLARYTRLLAQSPKECES
jgi:hypothetical protein